MNDIILPQTAYTAVSKKISDLYAVGINGIPAYGAQAPKGISPKAPIGTWKRWQKHQMPATIVKQLILDKPESVGAVTGSYAGNLEALDFDSIDAYEQFLEVCWLDSELYTNVMNELLAVKSMVERRTGY